METILIDKVTARRFVLGRQGLWPGRRWAGLEGTAQALRAAEAVQMDPLNVVARSQDIALWGRVLDYRPEFLSELLYGRREFFDYGGGLFVYPLGELPYWRTHMRRRQAEQRWSRFAAENQALLEQVRGELRARGPLGNRDFTGTRRVNSYRGRKDTALALYCLWLTGELLIHHRDGFERVYDFRANIVPPALDHAAPQEQAEQYFARKATAVMGLISERVWKNSFSGFIERKLDRTEAQRWLDTLVAQGTFAPVKMEGSRERWYVLQSDVARLLALQLGDVPGEWQPLGPTTRDEVTFLAPLEIVSARGRAAWLFDFDYVWEVYKPAHQRRWGYYVLPVLYGDRLVGRLDPKLDRQAMTLHIVGFWLEEHAPLDDPAFGLAFGRGLARFAGFLQARQVDLAAIKPLHLRRMVEEITRPELERFRSGKAGSNSFG